MARDWKTSFTAPAAAAQHTAPFAAALDGHGLVAIAAAPASIAVPVTWTEHAGPLGLGELSGASKVAAGGETSITWDRDPAASTAPRTLAAWLESRDDVGALNGTPLSFPAAAPSGAGVIDLPPLTTTVADCRIYVAVSRVGTTASAWVPTWSSPLTHEDVVAAPGYGSEAVRMGVASGPAATAGAYTISIGGLPPGEEMQVIAFALAPAEAGPPPGPVPPAENAIEAENRLTGTPPATWDITGAGAASIQGFATSMSVVRGGTLSLKVHSPNAAWTGKVYRLGYYAGLGAREVGTVSGAQTTQPSGTVDPATLMVSCANWGINGTWAVPADAPAGVYVIKIARTDDPTLASHIGPVVVRNPARKAPIVVKTSDSTWQAYNHAGADPADPFAGRNLYGTGTASAFTFNAATRCMAVSYDRPLVTRQFIPQTNFFNAEFPLLRWLERLGYDVDYVSSADVDIDPTLLLGRKVVVSSGHDEYWSAGTWDAFEGARDHATTPSHLVFLSGNEAFWRINWTAGHRSYACWKDSLAGALNASSVYSGTWQDTRSFNPTRRPPALLGGQRFRLNGIPPALKAGVNATHATSPFWRRTTVAGLMAGQTWLSPDWIVGFEADEPADTHGTEKPAGLIRLSEIQHSITGLLSDDNGAVYTGSGTYTHAFTIFRRSNGAVVWHAGTVQYAWGLDDTHDRSTGVSLVSPTLRQALTNLLADLGVLPPPYPFPTSLILPVPVPLDTYGFPPLPDTTTAGADQLCTPEDLASLLQLDYAALTAAQQATMTLLVEVATAVVQEAAGGQRIVEVVGDTATLLGTTDGWLDLPQRPVSAVTSVTLDGSAVAEGTTTGTYRRFGSRLWRDCGWATCHTEPSTVVVVNTHGYGAGAQELQLARSAVLSLARGGYSNPAGVTREAIDDYSVAYEAASAAMDASPHLKAALRRQYGQRAGLVRIGG